VTGERLRRARGNLALLPEAGVWPLPCRWRATLARAARRGAAAERRVVTMSITAKQPQPVAAPATPEDHEELTAEERRRRQIERNQPLIALLQTWRDEDLAADGDDDESLEEFMRAIDENRSPGSKLFEKYYS
jgi:hypothetical protein